MLNTQKLIYLLPDVAYIAELLPTKKEHTFAIQSFRQINGEFINEEDELIANNCAKLLSKIDAEEYKLVLPDFLFTNTIVSINETSESKVKEEIKTKLLPQLDLDKDTHDVQTFIVTQHGGKSKVQISALEKTVLEAFRVPAEKQGVKVSGVYPLSWTTKSIISLEPSISVVQIGTRLYSALHYIGVDQCTSQTTGEVSAIAETIKTLKGAEPSIQTVYLLTNQLVEQELKKELSDTLPLQQLTSYEDEQPDLPSYVKQIIESGLRTLSIPDFPVPQFPIGKILGTLSEITSPEEPESDDEDLETETPSAAKSTLQAIDIFEEDEEDDDEEIAELGEEELEGSALPLPTPPVVPVVGADISESSSNILASDSLTEPDEDASEINSALEEDEEKDEEVKSDRSETLIEDEDSEEEAIKEVTAVKDPFDRAASVIEQEEEDAELEVKTNTEPDITRFAAGAAGRIDSSEPLNSTRVAPVSKQVLKNRSKNRSLVRMLAVTLIVFLVTVGVGVGIGLGLLSLTSRQTTETPSPVASATPDSTPVVTATPTPTPEPEIQKDQFSILVVNATTVSGLAGKYQRSLDTAGYKSVGAGNAKGEYEEGENYILITEDNAALVAALQKDTGLTLTTDSSLDKTTEDARNQYDAVIVIADEAAE